MTQEDELALRLASRGGGRSSHGDNGAGVHYAYHHHHQRNHIPLLQRRQAATAAGGKSGGLTVRPGSVGLLLDAGPASATWSGGSVGPAALSLSPNAAPLSPLSLPPSASSRDWALEPGEGRSLFSATNITTTATANTTTATAGQDLNPGPGARPQTWSTPIIRVDSVVTDSNGNDSRYNSEDHLHGEIDDLDDHYYNYHNRYCNNLNPIGAAADSSPYANPSAVLALSPYTLSPLYVDTRDRGNSSSSSSNNNYNNNNYKSLASPAKESGTAGMTAVSGGGITSRTTSGRPGSSGGARRDAGGGGGGGGSRGGTGSTPSPKLKNGAGGGSSSGLAAHGGWEPGSGGGDARLSYASTNSSTTSTAGMPSSSSPGPASRMVAGNSSSNSSSNNHGSYSHGFNVPTVALTMAQPQPAVELDNDPTGVGVLTAAAGLASAHHSRAASFREPGRTTRTHLRVSGEGGGGSGGGGGGGGGNGGGGGSGGDAGGLGNLRRNSMPNVNNMLLVPGSDAAGSDGAGGKNDARIRRVRSFKTTSKGAIVNRGDSFKKKSTHSLMSTGSTVTDAERARNSLPLGVSANGLEGHGAASSPAYFRVNMMGAAGVGKTSLAQQFLTSEAVDHDDTDDTHQMNVTVLLDGEESTIEFIDSPDRNVISEGLEQLLDAYVVVFAINDHDSFDTAQQLVRFLRVDYGTDRAILLVANKTDLVRKRKVTPEEARLAATTFDCKYAETSAALNHCVDELLVGIITQIRLQLAIPFTTIFFPHKDAKRRKSKGTALCKGPRGFFCRLFRRNFHGKKERGVEDLMY